MGVGHLYNDNRPGIGGDPLPGQRIEPPKSNYPIGHGPMMPAWITFDKNALCFDAYFQQAVHESPVEQFRIRRCQVLFHLEDDTIQVVEPQILNSALPQGTIVRRHRIRKPTPNDECYYTVADFNVGINLELYGRVYRLVSCDKFTNDFLRKLGVRVNEPEAIPDDPYTLQRTAVSNSMKSRRPVKRSNRFRQFLDHDRHVLRFFCFWDDTNSLYGDARDFVLHYFLADDTVEIIERVPENSGREVIPCFLKRQKLPKCIPSPSDAVNSESEATEYYTEKDITLGAVLNVFGRKFLMCDCDEFTKEFYKKKYGITMFTPVHPPRAECNYTVKLENPPYNGWGTDEDSLANCHFLIPPANKTPQERCEPDVLRFMARITAGLGEQGGYHGCEDRGTRNFIVSYFLRDNTFMIYEPPIPNSGFKGGKFMERRKVMKPGQPIFRTELPAYYSSSDIYIGTRLMFNGFTFEIYSADEHTLTFMEGHPAEFAVANVPKILRRMKPLVHGREEEVRRMAKDADSGECGSLSFEEFGCFVKELLKAKSEEPICIVMHEIVTLARHYALNISKETNYIVALGLAQQHLRKIPFEGFQELLDACKSEDFKNTGTINRTDLRRICKANHLPLPGEIIQTLMEISQNFDNGMIYYESFINQLNWKCNPIPTGAEFCEYSGNLEVDFADILRGKPAKMGSSCLNLHESFGVERVRHVALVEDLINLSASKESDKKPLSKN
ncbi:hypothetical protein Aperf_G00000058353 [Anoplocephala perfoliata]